MMNENESRGLIAGELDRIARATQKAACPMCDLYEHRERQLRQNVWMLEQQHADIAARLDDERRWKTWCLAATLVFIVVAAGMLAVKP